MTKLTVKFTRVVKGLFQLLPSELLLWLDERMPYFAVLRYLRVMDHLPKTPTERVRKVELRDEGITADCHDRVAHGPERVA